MASFRTHISFGLALGALGPAFMAGLFALPPGWDFLAMVGTAAAVGSIAPDIDSDSGIPFHVTFASLSLVAAGLAFRYALAAYPGDWRYLAGLPLAAAFVVWAVIGWIFKKFTRHRGMAHSVPAAALAGLLTFEYAARAGIGDARAVWLGLAMAAGYALHLLLDEIHAATNFHGRPFVPNKAFGSALKFFSASAPVNVGVYGTVLLLASADVARIAAVLR